MLGDVHISANATDWVPLLVAVAAGSLGIIGVLVGRFLDRKARRDERTTLERHELRRDAAPVIGDATRTIRAGPPHVFAALSNPEMPQGQSESLMKRIEKRSREADEIRPRLSALAILWPEAREDLQQAEVYLSKLPSELTRILDSPLRADDLADKLEPKRDQALAALERTVVLLDRQYGWVGGNPSTPDSKDRGA